MSRQLAVERVGVAEIFRRASAVPTCRRESLKFAVGTPRQCLDTMIRLYSI